MPRKNIKKYYQNKTKKKKVNVDNNEEIIYKKKNLEDVEHDDNIDLYGVDLPG